MRPSHLRLLVATMTPLLFLGCGSSDGGGGSPVDANADDTALGDGIASDSSDTAIGLDGMTDSNTDSSGDTSSGGEWLSVKANRILKGDGTPFHGRGANLHDTRNCNACTYLAPDVTGWKRWADELIDKWGANFIRFDLEAYAADDGYRKQWKSLGVDDAYLADIKTMVTHMASKPGVYIIVTLFQDPSIKGESTDYDSEWPTDAAQPLYAKLAETFHDQPRVLFGLTNEPHGPAANDDELAARYTKSIGTIRTVEAKYGSAKHIVVVQAPQNYSRDLSYFVGKPLVGENLAYEVHPYNPKTDFDKLLVTPGKTLPIIIGEYGPFAGAMVDDDIKALWVVAQANEIPHIAWNFHQRCPPDMLQNTASDGCGLAASTGYAFPRTAWGDLFHDYLAKPW